MFFQPIKTSVAITVLLSLQVFALPQGSLPVPPANTNGGPVWPAGYVPGVTGVNAYTTCYSTCLPLATSAPGLYTNCLTSCQGATGYPYTGYPYNTGAPYNNGAPSCYGTCSTLATTAPDTYKVCLQNCQLAGQPY